MTSQRSSQPVAEGVLWGSALAALVLYFALGFLVSAGPPQGLDAVALGLLGRGGDLIAWTLTESGFFQTFALLLIAMLAGATLMGVVARKWRYFHRVVFSIVLMLVAWKVSDILKDFFHRARPENWLVRHETSFSYASGHATLGVCFWVLWAVFLWNSDLPLWLRRWGSILLVAFTLAVGWSRLELGAHYLSDVVGGYLLGIAFLCMALGIARRLPLALFSGR